MLLLCCCTTPPPTPPRAAVMKITALQVYDSVSVEKIAVLTALLYTPYGFIEDVASSHVTFVN